LQRFQEPTTRRRPQTAARGAARATLGMRLYDDLPEAKTETKGDAEGGGDEGRAWGATGPPGQVGDRAASEREASAGASRSGGEMKKSSSSAAGMLRAQATALRAAQARTKREAEARRAAAAAAAKKRAASTSMASVSEAKAGESGDKVHASCSSGEEEAEEPVADAYDPSAPNDYERTLAARGERARRKRDLDVNEDLRKMLEAKRKAMEAQNMSERTARREEILNVSGREARRRRVALRSKNDEGEAAERQSASAPKLSAAEKMMAKMGWTKGRGLGKTEQGMKTPLEVRATTGKIVNAAPVMFEAPPSGGLGLGAKSAPKKSAPKPLKGKPTTVLLLRNVVLRGEVEETLEDEIEDECEKFGSVVQVLIFEVTEQSFAPDEAVRVFVEFVDEEAAARAGAALNGRFFGKRVVKASFYELHKLDAGDLGPQKGEE